MSEGEKRMAGVQQIMPRRREGYYFRTELDGEAMEIGFVTLEELLQYIANIDLPANRPDAARQMP